MGLYHGLVPSSKDRAITVFGYVMSWPQLRMLDRSIVLDITWDYTMACIPWPGTQLKKDNVQ